MRSMVSTLHIVKWPQPVIHWFVWSGWQWMKKNAANLALQPFLFNVYYPCDRGRDNAEGLMSYPSVSVGRVTFPQ